MKKYISKFTPALLLVLFFITASFSGCGENLPCVDCPPNDTIPDPPLPTGTIGYITYTYDCHYSQIQYIGTDSARSIHGYYIFTENNRDTFATLTLPYHLTVFPIEYFMDPAFDRYSYKIEFEYEYGNVAIGCNHMDPGPIFPDAKGVNIIWARLIN